MEESSVVVAVVVDLAFTSQNYTTAHSEMVFEQFVTKSSAELHTDQETIIVETDFSDILENVEVLLKFKTSEVQLEVESTILLIGMKFNCLLKIVDQESLNKIKPNEFSMQRSAEKPIKMSLMLADRDLLRAMMLNESNGVLLKIRQRFPLTAQTRCDVIQSQIQVQLQELFAEFRANDVASFRALIPRNRDAFLLIWDHLSQLIAELCYHD